MIFDSFYTTGRQDAAVLVEIETLKDGRVIVCASDERLSQAAFKRMLKTEFPTTRFVVECEHGQHKAVSRRE